MRLRHNGSGQDPAGIELAARDHIEDPAEDRPAVKAG
jgi:hypothetical protein